MSSDDLPLEIPCPLCKAEPGRRCLSLVEGALLAYPHIERLNAYWRTLR